MTKDDITIYATQTCMYCHALTDWLDENKIDYTVKYVDTDADAYQEAKTRIGGEVQVVPITFIKDQKIEGFNRAQFASILTDHGLEINA